MDEPKTTVRTVPMLDTGIGREAGYRDDAEMITAMNAKRQEMRDLLTLLTPEAFARLEAAEAEVERRFLFGV